MRLSEYEYFIIIYSIENLYQDLKRKKKMPKILGFFNFLRSLPFTF